jgi:hypothetical protein
MNSKIEKYGKKIKKYICSIKVDKIPEYQLDLYIYRRFSRLSKDFKGFQA